jgi:hypothetical protein
LGDSIFFEEDPRVLKDMADFFIPDELMEPGGVLGEAEGSHSQ